MVEPRRSVTAAVLVALCGQFVVLGLVEAARDAPTVDEAVDLTAGLVAVNDRDLRMNPEHGLLHHVVPALLPVLLADPILPRTDAYREGDWFDYTDDLISANDQAGRLDDVVFWYRVIPLLAGAGAGLLVYALGSRLVGDLGGLLAAGLWFTTPYVLGLAHLSALDVSFTVALLGVLLLADRYRTRPTTARLVWLAVALGASLLVRHSAVALVPVVAGFVIAAHWSESVRVRLRNTALVFLLPIVVVWAAHRAIDPRPVGGIPGERFKDLVSVAADQGPVEAAVLAVPMPIEWRAGFAYLVVTSEERPAYAVGEYGTGRMPWYLPVNGLIKVPVTATVAVLLGLFGWWRTTGLDRRRAAVILGWPAAAIGAFLLFQPLHLGLRLALPLLALAFVVAAPLVRLRRSVTIVALCAIAAGQLTAVAVSFPDSLAWTPFPFDDGYRYVSDSSIDLGQANAAVRDRHRDAPFVAASLTEPRGYVTLDAVPRIDDVPADQLVGRVAVGATTLTVLDADSLSWLRAYCPVEVIGDSVLVYRFEEPPERSSGPDLPAAPCGNGPSRRGNS